MGRVAVNMYKVCTVFRRMRCVSGSASAQHGGGGADFRWQKVQYAG